MTPLKVGVIGAGGISHSHVPHWLAVGAEVRVNSIVGAEALAAEYGVGVTADRTELFEWADVIDICTPTWTHCDLALEAIAAGKDVLCEKPVGLDAAQARSVAAAARAAGVRVYPAHVVRYFPEYATLHAAVQDGVIGVPAVLRFTRGGAGATSDWFFDESLSGGIVLDQMIHDLDQARWIAGEVTQVYAAQNPPTDGRDVPRLVAAHVTLSHAGGAISHIQGVWGPPGMDFRTSYDVAGDHGSLRFSSGATGVVIENLAAEHSDGGYLPPASADESPYLTQIREVARAFRGGPPPRVGIDDGVIAVALADAARASIVSGRAVAFDTATALVAEGSMR